MSPTRLAMASCVSIVLASPAAAQYSYPHWFLTTTDGSPTSFGDRLNAYRNLVAKKTGQDGGSLTVEDKTRLDKRLRRLIAEEDERRNPFWPDGKKSGDPNPAFPSR